MIDHDVVLLRHRIGHWVTPVPGGFALTTNIDAAGRWTRENGDKLLGFLPAFGINPEHINLERSFVCGCCGAWRAAEVKVVYDHGGGAAFRCEKHAGRLPCIIKGCGRTFKLQLTDAYESQICCGRHWRMAPRRLRDLTTLVRRRAKRFGWTDKLLWQHHRFWMRCIRAIEAHGDVGGEGHIDIAEIERMFGLGD